MAAPALSAAAKRPAQAAAAPINRGREPPPGRPRRGAPGFASDGPPPPPRPGAPSPGPLLPDPEPRSAEAQRSPPGAAARPQAAHQTGRARSRSAAPGPPWRSAPPRARLENKPEDRHRRSDRRHPHCREGRPRHGDKTHPTSRRRRRARPAPGRRCNSPGRPPTRCPRATPLRTGDGAGGRWAERRGERDARRANGAGKAITPRRQKGQTKAKSQPRPKPAHQEGPPGRGAAAA